MKVIVAGDFCPRFRVQEMFDVGDYSAFNEIRATLSDADYSIVNLECPIVVDDACQPIKKCGPNLKTTSTVIKSLQYAGFDCVTLANNHFRDFGDDGCRSTIDLLNRVGVDYVGGGCNLSEAQQILYKNIGGNILAVINICEKEFSIATNDSAGSAPIDLIDNYYQIVEARGKADFVLMIVHGGHEYYQLPSLRMKKLYHYFVELGVDAVVNHHQHCYSGYEYYNGKPIVYGLGNLCFDSSNHRNSVWNDGYMVSINFGVDITLELVPYKQCALSPTVELLDENMRSQFNKSLSELNNVIADDKLLDKSFKEFALTRKKMIMSIFASYHNKYLNAAAYRSLIPYPLRDGEVEALENFIMCESHRDVVNSILSDLKQN